MLINSIGYQPQKAQLQNKNISFENQTAQTPLLKSLDKDMVSFSGWRDIFKKKPPIIPEGTIIKNGKRFVKESEEHIEGLKRDLAYLTKNIINNPKESDGAKETARAKIRLYEQIIKDGGNWIPL